MDDCLRWNWYVMEWNDANWSQQIPLASERNGLLWRNPAYSLTSESIGASGLNALAATIDFVSASKTYAYPIVPKYASSAHG
jgi:hypothetical protein